MSSGLYALLGVLLGGAITAGVTWWQNWREREAAWLTASRMISDELERLTFDLRYMIDQRAVPASMSEDFLSTSQWEEQRKTIARNLKNDPKGDEYWRGFSHLFASIRELRPALREVPGKQLDDSHLILLRHDFQSAARLYESLTEIEIPPLEPSPTPAALPQRDP